MKEASFEILRFCISSTMNFLHTLELFSKPEVIHNVDREVLETSTKLLLTTMDVLRDKCGLELPFDFREKIKQLSKEVEHGELGKVVKIAEELVKKLREYLLKI